MKKIPLVYEKLKAAYRELKESHIEMIFRMALLAEFRDTDTGTHLVRLSDYSSLIAESMGLSKKEIILVRYASPMHDIGKIMIPDAILKKKGELTLEERAVVHQHPLVGYEIFKNSKSPLMQVCGEIALTHHERFDGTGYPGELKGEEIPLFGRIVAVADCFDAYASERSYKEAFSFDHSVEMIMKRAGTHFDPQVVMAFMKYKDKIKTIWQANKDIHDFIEDMNANSKNDYGLL